MTRNRKFKQAARLAATQSGASYTAARRRIYEAPTTQIPGASEELQSKYTFETFFTGEFNRFAHAVAVAVTEAPGRAYSPLLLCGPSGVGKTHLLHAIGHRIRARDPQVTVSCVSAEQFTSEFIDAIRSDRADAFTKRYRELDIFLFDDLQYLDGKKATQQEIVQALDGLQSAGKQIVVTSNCLPRDIHELDDRLRGRLEGGLIASISVPATDDRVTLLEGKVALGGQTVPAAVLDLIAARATGSIHELEGALTRVTAFALFEGHKVDLALAERALEGLLPPATPHVTVDLIIEQVAAYLGLEVDEVTGPGGEHRTVRARHIAMYLCRKLTTMSLPRIGKQFGGRDHTSVSHAEQQIKQSLGANRELYNQVAELTERIKARP